MAKLNLRWKVFFVILVGSTFRFASAMTEQSMPSLVLDKACGIGKPTALDAAKAALEQLFAAS